MPSWWGKSSSKEAKKKTGKDNIFENFHFRKLKILSEEKGSFRSKAGFRRQSIDTISEKGSASRAESRSTSPSNEVSRCQSFADRPHSQVLPLPGVQHSHTDCRKPGVGAYQLKLNKHGKASSFLPVPAPEKTSSKPDTIDADGGLGTGTASVSSECSIDSNDPTELRQIAGYGRLSPKGNGHSNKSVASSTSSVMHPASSPTVSQKNSRQTLKPANLPHHAQVSHTSKRRGPLSTIEHPPSLQIPQYHAFGSGPDSSLSSPSRSPLQVFSSEQQNGCFWAPKAYPEVVPFGSGHCSSPGSGHNSVGGDMSGQLFWQPSKGSPEYSPIPSPRMTSPGPSSRIHSGAVTPLHPRAGGAGPESPTSWQDEGKQQQCHKLPLPPLIISNANQFCSSNALATTSSSLPRSPGRAENPPSPGLRWKKGKLLGRGTFGHVYVGFSNESGDMCAMKEVTLFADDAKSKECARQLGQEIALLSRLRHQNIVQYYGSETVDDKLYIYLEYVSGGSIHKLLQEYGAFSQPVIRSYTQQILSGLAYLHAKNTVHRDIKGANILVDPNGRVKLADFGMAKHSKQVEVQVLDTSLVVFAAVPGFLFPYAHEQVYGVVTGHSLALSFKGSPYWMAPEVIKNSNGCSLAVDIWSLGCTVLEMATRKPPWSQYEGVAALFKIGNSKELPAIPDSLSDEGKHFVKLCLQRNPSDRPTAAQLLEHPFVKNAAPLARPDFTGKPCELNNNVTSMIRQPGVGHARHLSSLDTEVIAIQKDRVVKSFQLCSDTHMPPFMSLPVSPTGSPHLHSRSPHHVSGRMSPASISSPLTMSGSSTPLTGGNGAIPFHLKYSSIHSESYGGIRSPSGLSLNSSTIGTYHDLKPDIFLGAQECPSLLREKMAAENRIHGKAFSRPTYGENQLQYGGQVALSEHVSQLLRNPANTNLSPDVRPSSPMLGHPRQFVKS